MRLAELERLSGEDGFWDKQESAQQTMMETKRLRSIVEPWKDLVAEIAELIELAELVRSDDPKGESPDAEGLAASASDAEKRLGDLEFRMMMSGPMDANNAFVQIHAGAGGTESCDWAAMLLRMYLRWAERRGFETEEVDLQDGEEAGIKGATILVKGEYAYGFLRPETGIHRLVRISPFDGAGRRHTSFASLHVSPELDDAINIEIDVEDLRIDTFRAGGKGGQHVNKTSSAIRITHLPTNTVVQCQNERSQLKNKNTAMKMLRARLYQLEVEKRQKEQDVVNASKSEIGFGHQIRSYVLHPYNLVKDLRTDEQTSNTTAVLDGDIDAFIESYLRQGMGAALDQNNGNGKKAEPAKKPEPGKKPSDR
jgi:peptide chain release factor 2